MSGAVREAKGLSATQAETHVMMNVRVANLSQMSRSAPLSLCPSPSLPVLSVCVSCSGGVMTRKMLRVSGLSVSGSAQTSGLVHVGDHVLEVC